MWRARQRGPPRRLISVSVSASPCFRGCIPPQDVLPSSAKQAGGAAPSRHEEDAMRGYAAAWMALGMVLAATVPAGAAQRARPQERQAMHTLRYRQPARDWVEALPVGNGRLGAMVFGDPGRETIQLNEATVWGGQPNRNDNPEAGAALPEIRRLVFAGKYKEAQDLANRK